MGAYIVVPFLGTSPLRSLIHCHSERKLGIFDKRLSDADAALENRYGRRYA